MSIWIIWLILAIILMIIEILVPAFFFALFSFSALCSVVIAFLFPKQVYWQVGVFVVISFILTVYVRKIFIKYFAKSDKEYKTNIDSLIGKRFKLIEEVNNDENRGAIVINGVRWRVITQDENNIEKNQKIEIIGIEGTKLIVKKVKEDE